MNERARRVPMLAIAAAAAISCDYLQRGAGESTPAPSGPVAEGRALMEQGQLDAALARLQQAPNDPESIYVQGLVWAEKARLAPPPEPDEEGGDPPRFKLEERNALAFFGTLTQGMPDHSGAHLATAELLAPHALDSARARKSRRGRRAAAAVEAAPGEPDFSVERVLAAYRAAIQHGDTAQPVEGLIEFCTALDDAECAGEGFRALIERVAESARPRIRYGDFLLEHEREEEAVRQYEIGLVWAPDDAETRGKIADVYLAAAEKHMRSREWAFAETAYQKAREYVGDGSSERARRLDAGQAELARVSGRR